MEKSFKTHSLDIVLIALFAAMLTSGKIALSFIPNIEIVTLFIVLISSVMGLKYSLPSTLIFVTVEILIYGFNYWVIAYYIYWPLLSIVIYLFKDRRPITIAIITVFMTFIFGIITTIMDTLFAGGIRIFFRLFFALYARGSIFYVVHIVSNFIIVILLYKPLNIQLNKIKLTLLN